MSMPLRGPKGRSSREKSQDRMLDLPVGLRILLALSGGAATGAEISRRINGDSLGCHVSDTTLYDELRRMEERGLVMRWHVGWQREVRLTTAGELALKRQVRDLQRALEVARERGLC